MAQPETFGILLHSTEQRQMLDTTPLLSERFEDFKEMNLFWKGPENFDIFLSDHLCLPAPCWCSKAASNVYQSFPSFCGHRILIIFHYKINKVLVKFSFFYFWQDEQKQFCGLAFF